MHLLKLTITTLSKAWAKTYALSVFIRIIPQQKNQTEIEFLGTLSRLKKGYEILLLPVYTFSIRSENGHFLWGPLG